MFYTMTIVMVVNGYFDLCAKCTNKKFAFIIVYIYIEPVKTYGLSKTHARD